MSTTIDDMTAEIASLRAHKQMIADGLAMLGFNNPTNVILRLQTQLREDRDSAQAELYAIERQHELAADSFRGEIYTLEENLSKTHRDMVDYHVTFELQSKELGELKSRLFDKEDKIMELHDQLNMVSETNAALTQNVDELQRQIYSGNVDSQETIRKLTEERDVWKNRHAVVVQSAERLRSELDKSKVVVPSSRRQLNPAAPAFVPVKPVQTLKEAVQQRMAEVTSKKEAISASLADAAATLTIAEEPVPDYKTDWLAYKEFCIRNIDNMLRSCVAEKISVDKVRIVTKLYIFIIGHGMPFMRVYNKFRLVVVSKCWEFKASWHNNIELDALMNRILEEFMGDIPQLPQGCGACPECYKQMSVYIAQFAKTVDINADMSAIGMGTPVKLVKNNVPAPKMRYRTRTRTGVIRRINYAEESDSE